MNSNLSLRLALAQGLFPDKSTYASQKELQELQENLKSPVFSSTESPSLSSDHTTSRLPHDVKIGVRNYLLDYVDINAFLNRKQKTSNTPSKTEAPRTPPIIHASLDERKLVQNLETYLQFDSYHVFPTQWMTTLGFLKASMDLNFITDERSRSAIENFRIETKNPENSSQQFRLKQIKGILEQIGEIKQAFIGRNIIDELQSPENQRTAILFLFLGTVLSDSVDLNSLTKKDATELNRALTKIIKASDYSKNVKNEAQLNAEVFLNYFQELICDRIIQEIERIHFAKPARITKPQVSGQDKYVLMNCLIELFANHSQLKSLQKLIYRSACKTDDPFNSILSAMILTESGDEDMSRNLLLTGIQIMTSESMPERIPISNEAGEAKILTIRSDFLEDSLHNDFFEYLIKIDENHAWLILKQIMISSSMFDSSIGFSPLTVRSDNVNAFAIIERAFSKQRTEELADEVLFAQNVSAAWKQEIIDYFESSEDPQSHLPTIKGYIAQSILDALADQDDYDVYSQALDFVKKHNSDAVGHLSLVHSKNQIPENIFIDLININGNLENVIQYAAEALVESPQLRIREQAFQFLILQPTAQRLFKFAIRKSIKQHLKLATTSSEEYLFMKKLIDADHPPLDAKKSEDFIKRLHAQIFALRTQKDTDPILHRQLEKIISSKYPLAAS